MAVNCSMVAIPAHNTGCDSRSAEKPLESCVAGLLRGLLSHTSLAWSGVAHKHTVRAQIYLFFSSTTLSGRPYLQFLLSAAFRSGQGLARRNLLPRTRYALAQTVQVHFYCSTTCTSDPCSYCAANMACSHATQWPNSSTLTKMAQL